MSRTSRASEFADALTAHFASGGFDLRTTELIAARAIGDEVVVLYREHPDWPVLGRRYTIGNLSALSGDCYTPSELAGNVMDEDILDPTGYGRLLEVDWADGLVDNPREVEWVGFGEEPEERPTEEPDPPGTTYDASYSPPPV